MLITGRKAARIFLCALSGLLLTVAVATGLLYATGHGYVVRAVSQTILKGYSTTRIDDHSDFENNVIRAGTQQPWALHEQYGRISPTDTLRRELEDFQTVAFVVVKDGKLLFEEYWDGYSDRSLTNSFSMAKSVTTMLLGKAIEQGYIRGLDQAITDFIPEFALDSLACLCTVGDLSAMTSGLGWEEAYYSPVNPTTEAYFGDDVEKLMLKQRFVEMPGKKFKYLSANTQLLAIVLQRATGMSISAYLEKEFWQPLGMEHDALWSKSGRMEKSFCCLNSNARDFARLGQLLLQRGSWHGVQLLDSAFTDKMTTPNCAAFDAGEPVKYGYSIWTDDIHIPAFYGMMGHLGQRVIVVPSENLVIVRLGKAKDKRSPGRGHLDPDNYIYVDEVVKMTGE
jgi:CubicO group peptidase (beta-lactamase class C family)